MNCPKCGTQNPEDVQVCTSCGSELTQLSTASETVKVRTSGIAIMAFAFTILAFFLLPFAVRLNSKLLAVIWIFIASLAIILGIIGLVQIGLSGGKVTGKAFASMGIAIPVVLFFLLVTRSVLYRPRSIAFRMVCGSNLSGIGRAMLIYANDWDNCFPRAGSLTSKWGTTPNWQADNRSDAFGLKPDGTGGSATISSSLYLLVKYAEVLPKSFICQSGDLRAKKFNPAKYGVRDKEFEDLWDFGPEPTKHCSYSYHIPYGPYPLTFTTSQPNLAVAADRNPWLDPYTDTTGFKWNDKTKTGPPENIIKIPERKFRPSQKRRPERIVYGLPRLFRKNIFLRRQRRQYLHLLGWLRYPAGRPTCNWQPARRQTRLPPRKRPAIKQFQMICSFSTLLPLL